jgi:hypothetical protein
MAQALSERGPEPKGLFQDREGNFSMNRLIAFIACCAGVVVMFLGVVAFLVHPLAEALGIVTVGGGVTTGSEVLKNAGRKLENGGIR